MICPSEVRWRQEATPADHHPGIQSPAWRTLAIAAGLVCGVLTCACSCRGNTAASDAGLQIPGDAASSTDAQNADATAPEDAREFAALPLEWAKDAFATLAIQANFFGGEDRLVGFLDLSNQMIAFDREAQVLTVLDVPIADSNNVLFTFAARFGSDRSLTYARSGPLGGTLVDVRRFDEQFTQIGGGPTGCWHGGSPVFGLTSDELEVIVSAPVPVGSNPKLQICRVSLGVPVGGETFVSVEEGIYYSLQVGVGATVLPDDRIAVCATRWPAAPAVNAVGEVLIIDAKAPGGPLIASRTLLGDAAVDARCQPIVTPAGIAAVWSERVPGSNTQWQTRGALLSTVDGALIHEPRTIAVFPRGAPREWGYHDDYLYAVMVGDDPYLIRVDVSTLIADPYYELSQSQVHYSYSARVVSDGTSAFIMELRNDAGWSGITIYKLGTFPQ